MTKFNKKSLALAVSAILGAGFAGTAAAEVFLGNTDSNYEPLHYASELVVSDSYALTPANKETGASLPYPLDIRARLGTRIIPDYQYYVRFDFDGASFAHDLNAGNYRIGTDSDTDPDNGDDGQGAVGGTCTDVGFGYAGGSGLCDLSEINKLTGQKGQSAVVFHLNAVGAQRTSDMSVWLLLNEIVGTDPTVSSGWLPADGDNPLKITKKSPVTVKYRLYDKQAQAYAGETAGLIAGPEQETLLDFAYPSFQFVANQPLIASAGDKAQTSPPVKIDVATESTRFDDGGTVVELGRLSLRDTCSDGGTPPAPTDAANMVDGYGCVEGGLSILLMDGTDVSTDPDFIEVLKASKANTVLQVAGDFAASVSGGLVYWVPGDKNCNDGTKNKAKTVTDSSATWVFENNGALDRIGICMEVNGTTSINGGTYIATLTPQVEDSDPAVKYEAAALEANLGNLTRNGTILQSPFFSLVDGYTSRFYLTNTGKTAAKVKIDVKSDGSITPVTTDSVIPGEGAVMLKGSDIATGGNRGFAVFSVQAPSENIEGVFQIRRDDSGDFDSYTMIKK